VAINYKDFFRVLAARVERVAYALALMLLAVSAAAQGEAKKVTIDGGRTNGAFRAIHSCNGGPITAGGMTDSSEFHREAGFPLMRLHDCQWPEPAVVDVHTIFRDFRQDAAEPGSYYFERTDDYIDSILKTGSQIFYRLGESIEHSQRKYDVHPPKDYEKWAAICLGVIRHYNEGWANGFRHNIRYWEVWNEPEIRPQMWSGTDEDYYRLYAITAKAIKARFPGLKVGGPAAANAGDFKGGAFRPSPFVAGLLAYCRENKTPLDFFSWHRYTDDPQELARRAAGVREMLDQLGFAQTESHLNEWNYLPGNDWSVFAKGTPADRERFYGEMGGPSGAAFTLCALIGLQDAPVDMTYFYTSGTDGFGLFNQHGAPKKVFYALKAFRKLMDTPVRLEVTGNEPGRLAVCAGINAEKTAATALIANYRSETGTVQLEFRNVLGQGPTAGEVIMVDSDHDWTTVDRLSFPGGEFTVRRPLKAPSVCVVRLMRAGTK
jgi:hypothetical protein